MTTAWIMLKGVKKLHFVHEIFFEKTLTAAFHKTYVKPIVQYNVLVYECTAFSNILPILFLEKNSTYGFVHCKKHQQKTIGYCVRIRNCLRASNLQTSQVHTVFCQKELKTFVERSFM